MLKSIARRLTICSVPFFLLLFFSASLTGCSSFKPIHTRMSGAPIITAVSGPLVFGLIYTNIRLPLTIDLHDTRVADNASPSSQMMDIKAPVGGRVQIRGNAIGAIAKQNRMQELYFADRHYFSILGFWSTHETIIYGK